MRIATIALALFAMACGAPPKPADAKAGVFWRPLGSWSGHGNTQTPSFTSDGGSLRVRWETHGETSPGAGAFRLTAQSAISGRPIEVAIDQHGAGRGTGYVDADPHVFYMLVESANLDWSFSVDEAFTGIVSTGADSSTAGKH